MPGSYEAMGVSCWVEWDGHCWQKYSVTEKWTISCATFHCLEKRERLDLKSFLSLHQTKAHFCREWQS